MKRKIISSILVIILFIQVLMPTVLGAQIGQADGEEVADATKEIEIKDIYFKSYLLQNYDINKDEKITENEIINIETLDINHSQISSIEGIENFINLKKIYAGGNNISSIEPLRNLKNLEYIDFDNNQIRDISPLAEKTNLSGMLTNNFIEDITPLKDSKLDICNLINITGNYIDISEGTENRKVLEENIKDENQLKYTISLFELTQKYGSPDERNDILDIKDSLKEKFISYEYTDKNEDGEITKGELNDFYSDYRIDLSDMDLEDKDIECLSYLTYVSELDLSNNNLKDVTPIAHMNNIRKLNLSYNNVDINTLKNKKYLTVLNLSNNNITDISILDKLGFDPGEYDWGKAGKDLEARKIRIYLANNNISDISVIKNIRRIAKLDLSNNKISDISPLKDYDFYCYEENGQVFEMLEMFDDINLDANKINFRVKENEQIVEFLKDKGVKIISNSQNPEPIDIEIKDEKLKKFLLENYDSDNDNILTDMDTIYIFEIDISNLGISSLEGLENFYDLEKIHAENNNITDLEPLRNLENLRYLNFRNNQIRDISPLAGKEKIEKGCDFTNNYIEDITPLKDSKPDIYNLIDFSGNYIDISEGTENRKALEERITDKNNLEYRIDAYELSQKYDSPDERNDVLDIKDNLKQKFIEYGIDKNNDGKITKGELNDFNSQKIPDEEGIFKEYKMDLSNMGLEDEDIKCLSYLNCVSELDLSNNNLKDVTPITHMKNVRKLNLSNNNIDLNTLQNKGYLIEINLSNNNITDISALDKLGYKTGYYGWYDWKLGGNYSNLRMIRIDLSYNNISDITVIKNIRRIAKLDLSHNKISDISPLKDYDFYCYEYEDSGQVVEDVAAFEGIDLSYNDIDINKEGNKQAIKVFKDKNVSLNCDKQSVLGPGEYRGELNTELFQFNKGESGGAAYISGEIVVVEWVNGISTVPTKTPKMRFISTDGEVDMEVFVTATGTNTYYFDRYIEGIDTTKEYKFMVESTDPNNVSEYNKVPVYFKGEWAGKVLGEYHDTEMKLVDNKIVFEEIDNTYVGDLNTELFQFNKGESGGAAYISGEIVVVEWVNGVSTVPTKTPKMRFISTDGEVDMEVFVTPTGTNTYYFDRYIEGIDTSKEYKFMVESTDPNNVSEYNKVPVYFKGQWDNKTIGDYQGLRMKLQNNSIVFTDYKYVGDLNTELFQFNKGESGGAAYISGEIVVVEWVNGVSTVPTKTPKMRFVSTDGTVDMEVFVTATGTNTYYFDRYIEGIDTTKEYKFMVESTDPNNVSEYNKVPVYFKGQWENKVLGQYHNTEMKLVNNKIIFE